MLCGHCGKAIPSELNFCPYCGKPVVSLPPSPDWLRDYAGFWPRVGTQLCDGVLLFLLVSALNVASASNSAQPPRPVPYQAVDVVQAIRDTAVTWLYYALFESSAWQATPGKMLLGIIVVDYQGRGISFARASARYLASWVSLLILGIGYLMVAFSKKKQAFHDEIAGCLVVRTRYRST